MKISLDSTILPQLIALHGTKAPKVLLSTMEERVRQAPPMVLDLELTLEDFPSKKAAGGYDLAVAKAILAHLNKVAAKSFMPVEANLKPIGMLLKDYTQERIQQVIDNKTAQWKGSDWERYLRPATIFRRSNFESYANEPIDEALVEKQLSSTLDALLAGGAK